jgi:hypothetical protein
MGRGPYFLTKPNGTLCRATEGALPHGCAQERGSDSHDSHQPARWVPSRGRTLLLLPEPSEQSEDARILNSFDRNSRIVRRNTTISWHSDPCQ